MKRAKRRLRRLLKKLPRPGVKTLLWVLVVLALVNGATLILAREARQRPLICFPLNLGLIGCLDQDDWNEAQVPAPTT